MTMTQEELNWALLGAAGEGDLDKVKEVIASGAQVDAKGFEGRQPLHYAAEGGCLPVVKYLIEEQGVQVDVKDDDGNQPLHYAARDGYLSVVKYLVGEQGAQVDAKGFEGRIPIELAGSYPEIQKFLQEWGSPENVEGRRTGALVAEIRTRQRQLGSLRPKGPAL